MEVYRKGSRNLPSHVDSTINWEESVYLNVIMHKVFVSSLFLLFMAATEVRAFNYGSHV